MSILCIERVVKARANQCKGKKAFSPHSTYTENYITNKKEC